MALPSVTYNFTNGTTADADQVDTNFTDIINALTDGSKSLTIDALTCAGAVALSSSLTMTGAILAAAGSVSAPSYGFSAGSNYGWYFATSAVRLTVNGTEAMSVNSSGKATLQPSSSIQTCLINGAAVQLTSTSSDGRYVSGANTAYQQFQGGASTDDGGIVRCYGSTHATKPGYLELYGVGLLQLTCSSSAARPLLTTAGRLSLDYTIDAGVVGGAIANVLAIVQAGNNTSPLNQTRQWAVYSALTASSAATGAASNPTVASFVSASTTAAASFTAPLRAGLYHFNVTKGAASTITRDVGVYVEAPTQGGTGNASFADNTSFSGSYNFNLSSSNPSVHAGTFSVGTVTSTNAAYYTNAAAILSSVSQQGYNASITGQSDATTEIIGFKGQATTANASFTCSNLYQFYALNTTKGAASTVTRHAMYGGAAPTQGSTANCFLTDQTNFATGNWGIYLTGANALFGPMLYGTATVASTATITALASTTSVVKISGSTGTTIQGITAPATGYQDGQMMHIFSVGAAVTIANENAGASAANRITTCTGADVVGTAPCAFTLVYDVTSTRWILMSANT